jgi:hypothetical protein
MMGSEVRELESRRVGEPEKKTIPLPGSPDPRLAGSPSRRQKPR